MYLFFTNLTPLGLKSSHLLTRNFTAQRNLVKVIMCEVRYVCVCGQCRQVCGLRTDFCRHTADTADKIADTLRTPWGQTADSGHNFFVAGRYLVSKYRIFRYQIPFNLNSFLLNADTLRTCCEHTADSRQVFADTLRILRTKLRTLRTIV
jgi:hypothetical protein